MATDQTPGAFLFGLRVMVIDGTTEGVPDTAANGLEALAVFEAEYIDLVIMDLIMPHMDGLETIRRIRRSSLVPKSCSFIAKNSKDDLWVAFGCSDYS